MKTIGRQYVVPVLILVLGIGWLLNVRNVHPAVNWIWTVGLAATGILTVAVGGWNKLTGVVGPFLLAGSVCSFFRQSGRLDLDLEIPILTIVLGSLLLLVNLLRLPVPDVLRDPPEKTTEAQKDGASG